MIQEDTVYKDVEEILIDTLGVDADEITPSAKFFDDLDGESIDVLDLSFRCEKHFGTTIRFQDLLDTNQVLSNTSTETALKPMQEQFPFLDLSQLDSGEAKNASSLFTVDVIVSFVKHSLAQNGPTQESDLEETSQ